MVTSSFGGGLVSGDAISLDLTVRDGASALLTTQASTKVYRGDSGSSQLTRLAVEREALAVCIPDHLVCFDRSRFEQRAEISLSDGSSALVWLDIQAAGRTARGERWDLSRLSTVLEIQRGGALLLRDALVLDQAHGDLRARMGRFDALGTLVLLGARLSGASSRLLAERAPPRRADPVVSGASALGGEGVMLRFAGSTVASALAFARTRLSFLLELLGSDPWARRW